MKIEIQDKVMKKEYVHNVILVMSGGVGARISEESIFKPKPMIEIGNK